MIISYKKESVTIGAGVVFGVEGSAIVFYLAEDHMATFEFNSSDVANLSYSLILQCYQAGRAVALLQKK